MSRLTVIVATSGRSSLRDTLESLKGQFQGNDRLFLVQDGPSTALVADSWKSVAFPGDYWTLDEGPHEDWGHSPRNLALNKVSSGYVYHLDDDDITCTSSLSSIHREIELNPGAFFFFRVVYPDEGAYAWNDRVAECGNVGTAIFVHPADIPLGRFGRTHDGDFGFIDSTLRLNADRPIVWVDQFIGVIQPQRWMTSYTRFLSDAGRGRHVIRQSHFERQS